MKYIDRLRRISHLIKKMEQKAGHQYNNGQVFGRPSKYDESYLDEIIEYVKDCAGDEKYPLPTAEGFAVRIGVNKTTLYEWAKVYEDFSNALGFLKSKQCIELVNGGLSNRFNSTITKLMLSNNHGYSDKIEHDVSENLIDLLHGKVAT
jgi:hypothetical protein